MIQRYWRLLKQTQEEWKEDNVSRLAASLAYFTAVSIAPLSLLIVVIAGFIWGGEQAAQAELMQYVRTTVGPEGARFVDMIVENADRPTFGSIAGVIGIGTLLWGSTNVFTQLQDTLNVIWDVDPEQNEIIVNLRRRLFSFAMVLAIAFVLMVSLALSTALNTIIGNVQSALPGGNWLWHILNFVFSLAVTTALFAAIFKVLPDREIQWRDVWLGAAATALLYAVGKFVLSYYLSHIGSAYGAAGSLIAFLLWVYVSAQILFLGAEFTQVYATQSEHQQAAEPAEQPLVTQQA